MSNGLDPARFWAITLREAEREMHAVSKIRQRETNERLWLAWHIVALDRTERLPKLETLLVRPEAPRRKQSPEEMLTAMKGIFLAFGGNPEELKTNGNAG